MIGLNQSIFCSTGKYLTCKEICIFPKSPTFFPVGGIGILTHPAMQTQIKIIGKIFNW